MDKIFLWFEISRGYALPMSVLSWVIIFVYCLKCGGNVWCGILSLIGICFAHLATNLFDDYFDFKSLSKSVDDSENVVLPNTQNGKCKYILNNTVSILDILKIAFGYSCIAFLIGIVLSIFAGKGVFIFMLLGGLVVLTYSFLSRIRLSEIAVGLCYGPILFCGVYYVMMSEFSWDALILSVPAMIFTINLVYTDTFMDKEIDKNENKKTFVGIFSDEVDIKIQKYLLILAYLSLLLVCIFDISDWQIFLALITIPLSVDLIESLKMYSVDKKSLPEKKWFHFPFEQWDKIQKDNSSSFMFRMYQARNIMIYFSIFYTVGLLLG